MSSTRKNNVSIKTGFMDTYSERVHDIDMNTLRQPKWNGDADTMDMMKEIGYGG